MKTQLPWIYQLSKEEYFLLYLVHVCLDQGDFQKMASNEIRNKVMKLQSGDSAQKKIINFHAFISRTSTFIPQILNFWKIYVCE